MQRTVSVAIFNTSIELTHLIEEVLNSNGFKTSTAYVPQLKSGEVNLNQFIKKNSPEVIIYDIAIPYEQNYLFFKKISHLGPAKGIPFVLTTTNKDVLENLVGKTGAIEIVGKPFDLKEIIGAIKRQARRNNNKKIDPKTINL